MPEVPAFLANFVEPRFARPVVVSSVETLAPRLRRVRFMGQSLEGVAFRPGQEIEFRVSDRAFRHYTPAVFDARAGMCEVLFFLHGRGVGSAWAERLTSGYPANLLGPGGGFGLTEVRRHVFLGDETALGVFACMRPAATGEVVGAVEVESKDLVGVAGLSFEPVLRTERRGGALEDWLESVRLPPSDDCVFYLVGHAQTIVRLRTKLLDRGFSRRSIRTKPYWADGKRGL